jgi:hypothetical protein
MLSLDVYEPPLLSVLVQGNSNQPHRKAVLYEELEGRPRATMVVSGNEDETRGTKHPHRDRGLGEVLPIGPELVGSGVTSRQAHRGSSSSPIRRARGTERSPPAPRRCAATPEAPRGWEAGPRSLGRTGLPLREGPLRSGSRGAIAPATWEATDKGCQRSPSPRRGRER